MALLNLLSFITLRGVLCGFREKTLASRSPGHQRVAMNVELRRGMQSQKQSHSTLGEEEFKQVTGLAMQWASDSFDIPGSVSVPSTQQHKGSSVPTKRERASNRGTLHHRLARESRHQFPSRI